MPYQGEYAYFMSEGSKLAADPSSDQNIPFNPMTDLAPPKPKYVDEEIRTFDSKTPKKIFTNELTPGEGPLGPMVFQDPFLLLMFFTHKVVGGVWGAGTGTLAGDFTAVDDLDTLGLQYRIKDLLSTNHINRLLKGGFPEKYEWIIEPGKLLKEQATVKFTDFSDNTQAATISNSFHDQSFGSGVGGWANWDNSGLGSTGKRSVVDFELKWGGAVLTGLDIKTMNLSFEVGYEVDQIYSSLSHTVDYPKAHNFNLTLNGIVRDKTLIAEYEQVFSSRTSQTLTALYDTTASENKGLTCTKVYISPESDIVPIPESGKAAEVALVMKGGEDFALSYLGSFLNLPDPSVLVTT